MPKYLVILLLCFCCVAVSAQQKKSTRALKQHRGFYTLQSPHDDCVFINKHSVTERLKYYPFNKSAKIMAVSYHNVDGAPNEIVQIDTTTGQIIQTVKFDTLRYGLRVKNGVLNPSSIAETVELNKTQINALTNLIYNTNFRIKGNNGVNPGSECFAPRNALLFIDQNGKIFDYIEICFACEKYESNRCRLSIWNN